MINGSYCKYIPSDIIKIFEDIILPSHRLTHQPEKLAPTVARQSICLSYQFPCFRDLAVVNHSQNALRSNLLKQRWTLPQTVKQS